MSGAFHALGELHMRRIATISLIVMPTGFLVGLATATVTSVVVARDHIFLAMLCFSLVSSVLSGVVFNEGKVSFMRFGIFIAVYSFFYALLSAVYLTMLLRGSA